MSNFKVKLIAVVSLLLLTLTISSAMAQTRYDGATTTDIALSNEGTCTICDNFGVTYEIKGTPGTAGAVTTEIRTENPQPTANTPSGISLTHFVVVTFNVNADDFTQAKITIPYTDSDVQGAQPPYSIYKYVPDTDTYIELAAGIDTNAKTFTITVDSVNDPLFAIGGAALVTSNDNGGFSPIAWAALGSSIVIIVLLVVVGVWYFKKSPH